MENNNEEVIVYENGEGSDKPIVEKINERLNMELADPKVMGALLATTFNGMTPVVAKQALMEGMIRGFKFEDFLHKDVYAIPYGSGYSLVTSIAHARKLGMRSGVIGKSAPKYTFKDEAKTKIESCEVTIKKVVNGHVGEFTALVYFDEYTTGRNLWKTKPKTMIAKVAEMHALRMACPEETALMYVEEELEKEVAHSPKTRLDKAKKESQGATMGNLVKDIEHGDTNKEENNKEA